MNSLNSLRTVVHPQRKTPPDPDEIRERAAALFGGPRPPHPESVPDAHPGPVPDARPDAGRIRRLRTWLFVRCGLEFKTVAALAAVLVIAGGLALHHFLAGRPRTVQVPPPLAGPSLFGAVRGPATATGTAKPRLTVDITGKVARPGLRRLPAGARVADALAAAGGTLPGTDTTSLNLARPLADGEQLLVGVPPPLGAPAPPSPAPGTPLSLNSATAPQLDALPGVGPVLAQHILDFRTQHGTFTSTQQLRQVPGIGDRKFTTLQPLVQP